MPDPKPQAPSPKPHVMRSIAVQTRVRYAECDPMGCAHHSVYPLWFELARTELLRESGLAYSEIEKTGMTIVVVKMELRYHKPARYDEVLEVTAKLNRSAGVRIEHDYEVKRGPDLLCTGSTTLACLDPHGKLTAVPQALWVEP